MREENRVLLQDLLKPMRTQTESEERTDQMISYRAGHNIEGLDLESRRERSRSV